MSRIGHDTSDECLLAEYRKGDEAAFSLLFKRYSKLLFAYVLGLVKDSDVAEDVTQKVFVKLSLRPELFKPRASFSSWIHQVARNAAIDALRSRNSEVFSENTTAGDRTNEENSNESIRSEAVQILVTRAIQKLDMRQREVIILREYSELSYREIADITGRTLSSVKQDIYQARQYLREELAPHLERTDPK